MNVGGGGSGGGDGGGGGGGSEHRLSKPSAAAINAAITATLPQAPESA